MADIPDPIRRARAQWGHPGQPRPDPADIEVPGPGQESVWDYPRPPRVERYAKEVRVEFAGATIACTRAALRVLETSHPPTYYIPPADVSFDHLRVGSKRSICEWKGPARYYDVVVGDRTARDSAWAYPDPFDDSLILRDHVAFYCAAMDACWVDGMRAKAQPGGFYGGWVTPHVVGPFKGGPGTGGW